MKAISNYRGLGAFCIILKSFSTVVLFLLGVPSFGEEPVVTKPLRIEERLDRVEGEIEFLREQVSLLINRTVPGFLNATYLKGGLSLLLPRKRTFGFGTDTGLGAFAGLGRYFGRSHVLELALQWDIYVASSLRYRIEIHTPSLTLGPVVGIKWKLLALRPFDRFLDDPDSVRGYFYVLGINFSLPMSRSLFVLEIDLLTNDQSIITIDAGIHLLL